MPQKSKEAYNAYHRKYQKERYATIRTEMVERLGGRCTECGSTEDLQFDHKDPAQKSAAVAKLLTRRRSTLIREIDKCQLLCAEHHKLKTSKERGGWNHGTQNGYQHHKCRCKLCIPVGRELARRRKLRKHKR